jgi:YebC/PmpR family DNA-binding regulatory protein
MSGHSKWATTKRQKFVTDAKRAAIFTRFANAITIAAREKGGNPDINFSLRLAIDKAKDVNMPKENIDRAIKRGTGELAGEHIEEMFYEGFGPSGIALLIEVTTDNKNRSVSDIKHALTKYDGNLGSANSVRWMFNYRGILGIPAQALNDNLELSLIEHGILDIKKEEDEATIITLPEDLQKIKNFLETHTIHSVFAEFDYLPQNPLTISDQHTREKIEKLFSELEDIPDVTHVYSNLV